MDQQNDDQYGYQEEDYGQDYYGDDQGNYEAEGEYTEEAYEDQAQLPARDNRSFFQKYANLIIFGGIGIFVLVMGYINFGHLLFSSGADNQSSIPQVTADSLLAPQEQVPTSVEATTDAPVADANAPVIPAAPDGGLEPVVQAPEMNAMGVSPAAPVTNNTTDGGIALSPAAPTNPEDPWSEVATTPQAAPTEETTAPTAPAAVTPKASNAPAASATAPDAVAVSPDEAGKVAEMQKKLDEADAARKEQEAAIAELQNRLAEAEAKANAPVAKSPEAETVEAAPQPKPKAKPKAVAKAAAPKPINNWELRSASDGMAWITRRGENQLFRVDVGDEVPGIGRVTAIREQGGRWVVVGTQGMIRQ